MSLLLTVTLYILVCFCSRYRSTCHNDFVSGVSWCGEESLYSCGWDGKVLSHKCKFPVFTKKTEGEATTMEVNGFTPEQTSDIKDNLPKKAPTNESGDGDANEISCDT